MATAHRQQSQHRRLLSRSAAQHRWQQLVRGQCHTGSGKYSVYEGFLEANLPLVDTPGAGKANLNLAGRATLTAPGTVYNVEDRRHLADAGGRHRLAR
jgi:hypothetical protein